MSELLKIAYDAADGIEDYHVNTENEATIAARNAATEHANVLMGRYPELRGEIREMDPEAYTDHLSAKPSTARTMGATIGGALAGVIPGALVGGMIASHHNVVPGMVLGGALGAAALGGIMGYGVHSQDKRLTDEEERRKDYLSYAEAAYDSIKDHLPHYQMANIEQSRRKEEVYDRYVAPRY